MNSLSIDEAKIGYKSKNEAFSGYKTYIAMTDERILTAATVTTGEKADGKELKTLLYKTVNQGIIIEEIIEDTAYSGKENIKITQETNYHLIAKLNPIVSNSYRKKRR